MFVLICFLIFLFGKSFFLGSWPDKTSHMNFTVMGFIVVAPGGGHDPRVTQSRVISHIPEARVKSFFHQLLDGLHFLHLNKAREPASAPAERNRTHAARSLSHLCAAAPATQIIHRDLKVGQRACAPAWDVDR